MQRSSAPALIVLLSTWSLAALGQTSAIQYAGLFRTGTSANSFFCEQTWEQVSANYQRTWAPRGQRIVAIDAYDSDGTRFCVTLQQSTEPFLIYQSQSSADFNRYAAANSAARLVDVEVVPTARGLTYFGVWHGRAGGPQNIVHDLDWQAFEKQHNQVTARGARLVAIEPYLAGGAVRFSAAYETGTDRNGLLRATSVEDIASFQERSQAAMQLVDYEVYDEGGRRYHIGVWRGATGRSRFVHGLTQDGVLAELRRASGERLQLAAVKAYPAAAPERLANAGRLPQAIRIDPAPTRRPPVTTAPVQEPAPTSPEPAPEASPPDPVATAPAPAAEPAPAPAPVLGGSPGLGKAVLGGAACRIEAADIRTCPGGGMGLGPAFIDRELDRLQDGLALGCCTALDELGSRLGECAVVDAELLARFDCASE